VKNLPLKLGIGVVLLFAAVIATCLLWTPVKVRYYTNMLGSSDKNTRLSGVSELLAIGMKGNKALSNHYKCSEEEIEFLAKHWPKPNYAIPEDEYKRFPLYYASEYGFYVAVILLVERGAKVNARCSNGFTPLHRAAVGGHKRIASYLIEKDAIVNAKDGLDRIPLHYAAHHGHKEVITLLLEKKSIVNPKDYHTNYTPLDFAIDNDKKETVALLRAHGAKTAEELKKESRE